MSWRLSLGYVIVIDNLTQAYIHLGTGLLSWRIAFISWPVDKSALSTSALMCFFCKETLVA